jgi:hypothetical protein
VVLLQNLVLGKFNSLIGQVEKNFCGRKIEEVPGDGAFDRKEIFDHLQEKGIQLIIKTWSNANIKQEGYLLEPKQ